MGLSLEDVSLTVLVAAFVACAATIAVAGTRHADVGHAAAGTAAAPGVQIATIGFESVSILALCAAGVAILLG